MRPSDGIRGTAVVDAVRHAGLRFESGRDGLQPILDLTGDARVVLIGKAIADLTAALNQEKRLNIVAVETDWPDADRVNRWVRLMSTENGPVIHVDTTAALTPLERWSYECADLPETYLTGV